MTITNSANTFTTIAQNAAGRTVTNTLAVNLPQSAALLYDANGNLTNDGLRSLSYDAENQLTNVMVAGQWREDFLYDALNRRRVTRAYTWSSGSWILASESRFIYDGNNVIQERDTNNTVLVTYTRGAGGLLARTDARGTAFYHADGNHNITALVNGSQYVVARYLYDVFGRPLGQWGPLADANVYRAASKEWDYKAGFYYFGRRYYDPNLQRWLNRDPIKERGGLNLYAYCQNNPISLYDPTGLLPCWLQNLINGLFGDDEGYNPLNDPFNPINNPLFNPYIDPTASQWNFGPSQDQNNAQLMESFQLAVEGIDFTPGDYQPTEPSAFSIFMLGLGPVAAEAGAVSTAADTVIPSVRFEGLTEEQIQAVQAAMQKAGISSDANLLIKGADMPAEYTGMTLGDEGFVVNRSVINNSEELQNTLAHEYQHIIDRRALGDPGAYGQALEDAARAAENH